MKKLFTLMALILFVGGVKAQDQTLFYWQFDGGKNVPECGKALEATGGTITFNAASDKETGFAVESAAYHASVTDDMKSGGTNGLKIGKNASTITITLTEAVQADDQIVICGYNTLKITDGEGNDVEGSLATGATKSDYRLGTVTLESAVSKLTISRASGSGTGIAAIKIIRPDKNKEVTEEIFKVTVNGTDIASSDLEVLKTYKTLAIDAAYDGIPTVSYEVKTTTTDSSGTTTSYTDYDLTVTDNDGTYSTTFTFGEDEYTITFTNIYVQNVFTVTEDCELVLTKENVNKYNYLSVTTNNWQTDREYGKNKEYVGDFYNMSNADRALTIKAEGAKYFEVFVQNNTANRPYILKATSNGRNIVDETIYHRGSGLESSGLYEGGEGEVEITVSGGGASVYPVVVKFYYDEIPSVAVSVGSEGFATLTPEVALDFTNSTIKAYKAAVSGNEITLTKTDIVAAGEGVLLYNEGEENVVRALGNLTPADDNAFVGVTKGVDLASETNGNKNYILNVVNEKIGFYLAAGKRVDAGKAYLSVPATSAKESYVIRFADDDAIITGINEVKAADNDNVIFNLSGMRMKDMNQKGVYIVNGKKVVKK